MKDFFALYLYEHITSFVQQDVLPVPVIDNIKVPVKIVKRLNRFWVKRKKTSDEAFFQESFKKGNLIMK